MEYIPPTADTPAMIKVGYSEGVTQRIIKVEYSAPVHGYFDPDRLKKTRVIFFGATTGKQPPELPYLLVTPPIGSDIMSEESQIETTPGQAKKSAQDGMRPIPAEAALARVQGRAENPTDFKARIRQLEADTSSQDNQAHPLKRRAWQNGAKNGMVVDTEIGVTGVSYGSTVLSLSSAGVGVGASSMETSFDPTQLIMNGYRLRVMTKYLPPSMPAPFPILEQALNLSTGGGALAAAMTLLGAL